MCVCLWVCGYIYGCRSVNLCVGKHVYGSVCINLWACKHVYVCAVCIAEVRVWVGVMPWEMLATSLCHCLSLAWNLVSRL